MPKIGTVCARALRTRKSPHKDKGTDNIREIDTSTFLQTIQAMEISESTSAKIVPCTKFIESLLELAKKMLLET